MEPIGPGGVAHGEDLVRVRVRLGVRLGLGSGLGSGSGLGLGLGLRLGCKKAEKTESIRGGTDPYSSAAALPAFRGFTKSPTEVAHSPPRRVGRSVPSFTHFLGGGCLSGQLPAASKVGWSVGYFTHCATSRSSGKILSVRYRLCVLIIDKIT